MLLEHSKLEYLDNNCNFPANSTSAEPYMHAHVCVGVGSTRERIGDFDPYNRAKMCLSSPISSHKMASIQARPRLYLDTAQPWFSAYSIYGLSIFCFIYTAYETKHTKSRACTHREEQEEGGSSGPEHSQDHFESESGELVDCLRSPSFYMV